MDVTTESLVVASPAAPRLRVVLCEADPPLRRLISEWLIGAGLEPVPCSGSAQGAAALVVADVQRPRVDGAARIAALRASFPGAQVLAISGYFITSGATAAARRSESSWFMSLAPLVEVCPTTSTVIAGCATARRCRSRRAKRNAAGPPFAP